MKMQINRLFEIVYILLNKKTITAKELAERFEVSMRTIYRDIDTLSAAGIPIYTSKGKGGGISLLENFVLNKSMLTDMEQNEILTSLQGLSAVKLPDIEPVLNKLSVLFNKKGVNWIDIDFSHWGSDASEKEKFNDIKSSILNCNLVTFDYYSSYGEKTERTVEPIKLLFKGQSWYLYGFCKAKSDFRIFKITRISNLHCENENFSRDIPDDIWEAFEPFSNNMVTLVLRIDGKMAYRIFDEFNKEHIKRNEDGTFNVVATYPEDEWVYGFIMSFGSYAEVVEPEYIRNIIRKRFEDGLNKYSGII
jgi:predicted DNA-binding transcriptional regulator YafY